MTPAKYFTPAEKEAIVDAIREAEKNTSGEIRVHIENHAKKATLDRAAQVFADLKMHKTALRNGVLVYVALEDHKLAILGDAGINAKRNIVLSTVIAGGLSGIGGGLYYLAGTGQYVLEKEILTRGFDGIPVALLANSNPIGTIFSSLFVSYLSVGGNAMQPAFSTETVNLIIAVIIYLAAFSLLVRTLLGKVLAERKHKKGESDK